MVKAAVKYRIHRTVAIIVVPLVLISTLTGVFKANQKWYWEDGYKKKKQPSHFSIDQEIVPVNVLLKTIDSLSQKKNIIQEITIKSENGTPYYRVLTKSKEKYLAEVYTGKIVSPLSTELASDFATQYIKGKAKVKTSELLTDYIQRKEKEAKAVYKVTFDNETHSEVYLDYYTGEIVEDIDDNRRFGIWVMRLHEYDFFNSKRSLTSIVGTGILLLALSGLWIYKLRLKLRNGAQV